MAIENNNTSPAQNKLGELYVDFGTKGLGNLVKGLNGISAQFLLTKNAATQFIKPVLSMTHAFGDSARGLEKMRLTFGTTIQMAQRMQAVFHKMGIDEVAQDIQKLSDILTSKDYTGFSSNFIMGMQKLGINFSNYDGSLQSTMQLLDLIGNRLKELPANEGRMVGSWISQDYGNLMYALERGIKFSNIPSMANELSQDEINKQIEAEENFRQAVIDIKNMLGKVYAHHGDDIIRAIQGVDNFFTNSSFMSNLESFIDFVKSKWEWLTIGLAGYFLGGRAGAVTALGLKWAEGAVGKKIQSGDLPLSVSPYGTSMPGQLNFEPNALKNSLNNGETALFRNPFAQQNITINQTITSTDPHLAGTEAANKFKEAQRNVAVYGIKY